MACIVVQESALRKYVQEVLAKVGIRAEDAKIIADSLIEANLRGIDTHGVVRLSLYYLKRIKKGFISKYSQYKVTRKSHSAATLDADKGPGEVATLQVIRLAMSIAKETGVGLVGVKKQ